MQVMAESRPGVGRVFARWNPVAFVTLYLGLLCMDSANSQCPAGMCERPPSTTSTQPTKDSMCYKCGDSLLINCNPGFRQNGDNYIAKCENEVWTPDNGCQIDLFTILVASSASLVAILIFALFVLCIVEYRFSPKKRKHHEVSKANGEKKRRAHQNTGCEVANGQKIGKKPVNDSEDFEDDFTDDEETQRSRSDMPLQDISQISTITTGSHTGNPVENSKLPPEPEARLLTNTHGHPTENAQLPLVYLHSSQETVCQTDYEVMVSEHTTDHLSNRPTSAPK